jgi:hypothetical protein
MLRMYLIEGIVMKSKKMIPGMAAILFYLVLVGALSAQEYERDVSGFAVEGTVAPSSNQLNLNANWGVMGQQTKKVSLEELESAYYYQMIEEQYINNNDGQMEISAPHKDQLERNNNHPSCKC